MLTSCRFLLIDSWKTYRMLIVFDSWIIEALLIENGEEALLNWMCGFTEVEVGTLSEAASKAAL